MLALHVENGMELSKFRKEPVHILSLQNNVTILNTVFMINYGFMFTGLLSVFVCLKLASHHQEGNSMNLYWE